ncbi:hypothetical protein [Pedobacter xixiisoli]|uniref:Tetratricopeptide repeat-containing protein n=1 Tax=Pedobacter xixiisoli TaxID=1476464 RepID=A0A285ZZW1_9SPHI|nr:hypothetical protein [Pedobacter xixiisoli]SOD15168.1 hypothetical protein SAMN06297358_2144 [Pedobacter xixiisoli]
MTEDKILWTARYAEGDLNETESLAYESLLKHDQELKEHLLDYLEAHGSLRMLFAYDNERKSLVSTLEALNEEYFDNIEAAEAEIDTVQPKVTKLSTYLRWVSGLAAVFVLGMLIWAPWKGDLYEQFNAAPQMNVAERGAEKTDLDQAATLFNDKKYQEAKVALSKLNLADSQNAMVTYYYGVSLIETSEVAKGRLLLEELFKGDSVYKYDAAYAMAMSYLKEDKKVDTRFWLEKIPDGAVQFEKAQQLLKKL